MSILYVKIIGSNHGNYPYRIGLNTLKHNNEIFNTRDCCGSGGLYYTTPEHIFEYTLYGDKVCILTIPKDAKILHKWNKSDKIIIEKIMPLWDLQTIQYLISLGAMKSDLLGHAAARGHLDIVQYLVSMADIHAYDDCAVRWASAHGHLNVVQYLVSIGANIHARRNGALQWASRNGHLEVVKYLVSIGADIHPKNDQSLLWASFGDHLNVVQYLQSIKNES